MLNRRFRSLSGLSALAALAGSGACVASGCTGETENVYATVGRWECFEVLDVAGGAGGEGGASGSHEKPGCDCYGVERHRSVEDTRPKVNRCGASDIDVSGWQCCYAWQEGDTFRCRCEDAPADQQAAAYCAANAALVEGEVLTRCPPTPLDNVTYCAFEGEACEPTYLDEQGLSGCCQDLVCQKDRHGVSVCKGR